MKDEYITLESEINLPLSPMELGILKLMYKEDDLNFNIRILISKLLEISERGQVTYHENDIINQAIKKFAIDEARKMPKIVLKPVRALPKFIYKDKNIFVARRVIEGKRIYICRDTDLSVVKKALKKFNKKNKLNNDTNSKKLCIG